MSEKKKNIALSVRNLHIFYRGLKKTSIRSSWMHFKDKVEVFEALKGVSFDLEEGKILGIIGKNGSGKSTMLRAIAGIFSPDEGTIDLHGLHSYGFSPVCILICIGKDDGHLKTLPHSLHS